MGVDCVLPSNQVAEDLFLAGRFDESMRLVECTLINHKERAGSTPAANAEATPSLSLAVQLSFELGQPTADTLAMVRAHCGTDSAIPAGIALLWWVCLPLLWRLQTSLQTSPPALTLSLSPLPLPLQPSASRARKAA